MSELDAEAMGRHDLIVDAVEEILKVLELRYDLCGKNINFLCNITYQQHAGGTDCQGIHERTSHEWLG